MSRNLGISLLAAGALVISAPALVDAAPPKAKIGVIMHDHGAPREHNAESYYGIKWFLNHLVHMDVIPMFVANGGSGWQTIASGCVT